MSIDTEIRGRRFEEEQVRLDGLAYLDCVLTRCALEYHGTGPIRLETCRIDDCSIAYRGAAAVTIQALQTLAQSGPQGLDHVMRLFLPSADIDWQALAAPTAKPRRRAG